MKFCQDCGEEQPKGWRRIRCPRCKLLVCGWCMNHVHELNISLDHAPAAQKAEATP